jgi:peptidylprolyl isomerase
MKKSLLFTLFLSLSFNACDASRPSKNDTDKKSQVSEIKADSSGLSLSTITVKTAHGDIIFKLYPQHAPNTSARIVELTKQGFYDGLTFHRVVPKFVVQGGDPKGNGTGGSGQNLKAEFSDLQHIKGTVAMARAADKDSADSQFYIALNTLPHLDGQYTVFGQVVEGLEFVEKVQAGDKILSMTYNEVIEQQEE